VDTFEILTRRRLRLQGDERLAKTGLVDTVKHRVEALGALRVAGAGEMFEIRRMGSEQHGHVDRRYLPPAVAELPFEP
jgi:hypothetical protein